MLFFDINCDLLIRHQGPAMNDMLIYDRLVHSITFHWSDKAVLDAEWMSEMTVDVSASNLCHSFDLNAPEYYWLNELMEPIA